jgi:hypothetical protein
MPDTPIPWVGLATVAAMVLLPLLPDWLFEGPRTSKHWLRRHICGDCGAPWTDEHSCTSMESQAHPVLRGRLRRLPQALHGVPGGNRPKRPRSGVAAWCAFTALAGAQPIGISAPLGCSCA